MRYSDFNVRMAKANDARDILGIYGPYIENTTVTFESEMPSVESFENRIDTCLQRFPWLVCEIDGRIAGYVYASGYRERIAYQWSCECSIYLHDDFKGKGIGTHLYYGLFEILRIQGYRTAYAVIDLPNEASVRVHEKCGFKWFATYENVGYKLGQWKNVGWWRLQINDYNTEPAPPLKLKETNPLVVAEILKTASQRIREQFKD
jgi:L-amino acid N-acyltransferase YncA